MIRDDDTIDTRRTHLPHLRCRRNEHGGFNLRRKVSANLPTNPKLDGDFRPFAAVAVPEVALRISVHHDGLMTAGRMTRATGARDSWIFTTRLGKRREVATTGDPGKKKGSWERGCGVTQFLRSLVQTRKTQQLLRIFFPPRIQISCHPSNSNKIEHKTWAIRDIRAPRSRRHSRWIFQLYRAISSQQKSSCSLPRELFKIL